MAYHRVSASGFGSRLPGVIFLPGFKSDMTGSKATALEEFCRSRGQAFLSFDYFGHGRSSGAFTDGSIGRWAEDVVAALDALSEGPQILVGSSMGGWLMLLAALQRLDRIHALIGIAAAPDFTEDLIWASLSSVDREKMRHEGQLAQPSDYSDEPYVITRLLIEEGRRHLLLRDRIGIDRPVRLLHGMVDSDVPYTISLQLADCLTSADVQIRLIKDGDHRLARPQDLKLLFDQVAALSSQFPV
ncbi:alpha/beta hydrolase [Dongia soli]|uniref:Palmitoyl-protein thioesterase ABHD10, mitochondrial n=1 Tax=Dongia soli TaxID=600628 RepID=A0ABU5E666_9PROT|nr:alpha/beta hydrolase [Dongia soli]MDY0881788.1 alpha/beta hydrolase [Dongia soli]